MAAINAAMAGKAAGLAHINQEGKLTLRAAASVPAGAGAAAGDTSAATAAKMRRFLSPPPPSMLRGSTSSKGPQLQHPQGRTI